MYTVLYEQVTFLLLAALHLVFRKPSELYRGVIFLKNV